MNRSAATHHDTNTPESARIDDRWLSRVAPGLLAVFSALTLASAPALASSDAAWEAFRADVADQCTQAAQNQLSDIRVRVDPFGSEQYGLALIDGVAEQAETRSQLICVYDKQDQSVEIGTPLGDTAAEKSAP